jgi:hypothetical protein
MSVEKTSNHGANQSPSGKDYFSELAFLRLGDILSEIAHKSREYPRDAPHREEVSIKNVGRKRLVGPAKGYAATLSKPRLLRVANEKAKKLTGAGVVSVEDKKGAVEQNRPSLSR